MTIAFVINECKLYIGHVRYVAQLALLLKLDQWVFSLWHRYREGLIDRAELGRRLHSR